MLNLHVIGLESLGNKVDQELDELEADVLMSEIEECLSDLYQLANFGDAITNTTSNIEAFVNVIKEQGISAGMLALIQDELKEAGYYIPDLEADGSNAEIVAQATCEALSDKLKKAKDAVVAWIKKVFEKLMLFINKWIKLDVLRIRKLEKIKGKLSDLSKVDKEAFDKTEIKVVSYKEFEQILKDINELEKSVKGEYTAANGELAKFETPKVEQAQKLSSLGWSLDNLVKAVDIIKAKLDGFKDMAKVASKAQSDVMKEVNKDDENAVKAAREQARYILSAYTAYSKALTYAYKVVVTVASKVKVKS